MSKAGRISVYVIGTLFILTGFYLVIQAIFTSTNPFTVSTVNVELFLAVLLFAIGGVMIYYIGKSSEKTSKYICGHCDAIFDSELNLKIHYDSKHSEQK